MTQHEHREKLLPRPLPPDEELLSGNVARAWDRWRVQPSLLLARSPSAEKRAQRRQLAKTLADHPTIEDA